MYCVTNEKIVQIFFYLAFISDDGITNAELFSNNRKQGEGSVAAGIRCSFPSPPIPNDGVAPGGGRQGSSGTPHPCGSSTLFVVCPSEENACLYSGIWEIDLWNDTSNDCVHDCNMTWNHDQSCCQSATCYNKGLCNGSFPTDCNDKNCTLIRNCEYCASYYFWGKDHCQLVSCEECLNGKDAYVFKSEIFKVPSGEIN